MRRSVVQIKGLVRTSQPYMHELHEPACVVDMFSLFTILSDATVVHICTNVMPSAFIRMVERRKQSVDSKSFFLSIFALLFSMTLNCILYISPVLVFVFFFQLLRGTTRYSLILWRTDTTFRYSHFHIRIVRYHRI